MINLPTWITIIRIFLTPVLVVVLMTRSTGLEHFGLSWQMIGVTVFLLASCTDYLDGWLARRRNEVTTLGILLDPIADKLLTSAAFISLVQIGAAHAWMVWIIVGREFAVDGLRMIASSQGVTIGASVWGKYKTATQVVAIVLLIFGNRYLGRWDLAGDIAISAVVVLAIFSAIDYFLKFSRRLGVIGTAGGAGGGGGR
ncbi:MAG TPA: CDP-diacylglycerol--glycerol-3-phosphate 3-phosphatidyltransferase [Candidatus Polarisedimenticolia bacterium]|nr:CDP-diacylglycerol--glycerol-3-phosphate 3-phosphatidyltransferase [Candidatus Polarisedimenticolia bacterium]